MDQLVCDQRKFKYLNMVLTLNDLSFNSLIAQSDFVKKCHKKLIRWNHSYLKYALVLVDYKEFFVQGFLQYSK